MMLSVSTLLLFDMTQVYDRDLTTDDFMGSASVMLSDLEMDKWVQYIYISVCTKPVVPNPSGLLPLKTMLCLLAPPCRRLHYVYVRWTLSSISQAISKD